MRKHHRKQKYGCLVKEPTPHDRLPWLMFVNASTVSFQNGVVNTFELLTSADPCFSTAEPPLLLFQRHTGMSHRPPCSVAVLRNADRNVASTWDFQRPWHAPTQIVQCYRLSGKAGTTFMRCCRVTSLQYSWPINCLECKGVHTGGLIVWHSGDNISFGG